MSSESNSSKIDLLTQNLRNSSRFFGLQKLENKFFYSFKICHAL